MENQRHAETWDWPQPFTPKFKKYIVPTWSSEIVRVGSIIILHLSKLWKPSSSYRVVKYFWWGCGGNLALIALGSGRPSATCAKFSADLWSQSVLFFIFLNCQLEVFFVLFWPRTTPAHSPPKRRRPEVTDAADESEPKGGKRGLRGLVRPLGPSFYFTLLRFLSYFQTKSETKLNSASGVRELSCGLLCDASGCGTIEKWSISFETWRPFRWQCVKLWRSESLVECHTGRTRANSPTKLSRNLPNLPNELFFSYAGGMMSSASVFLPRQSTCLVFTSNFLIPQRGGYREVQNINTLTAHVQHRRVWGRAAHF